MDYQPLKTGTNVTQPPQLAAGRSSGVQFDVRRFFAVTVSNWYWILLSILIALSIAFFYIQITRPIYAIKSALVVNEDENSNSDILDKLNLVKKTPVNFFNEMNAVRSEDLVTQTVDTLNLNIHYFIKGKLHDNELYSNCPIRVVFDTTGYRGDRVEFSVRYTSDGHFDLKEHEKTVDASFDSWISRPYGRFKILYANDLSSPNKYLLNEITIRINSVETSVREILTDFKVTSTDGRTSVMDLSYRDNIPDRGVDFMNTLIRIYYRNKLKNIDLGAQKTRDFIDRHKADLMGDLRAVDSSVETIKSNNNVIDLPSEANTYSTEKNVLNKNIDEMLARRKSLINLRYLLQNSRYQIIVPLDIRDNILEGLINDYNVQVKKLETQEKVQELGASNPFMIETLVELDALKRRMLDVLNRISSTLDTDIEVAKQSQTDNLAHLKNIPSIDRSINEVKRGYDVLQNMYLFLFQKGIENEISVYNESNKSKILIAPYATSSPISPVKNYIYGLWFLIGLLIPILILLILQLLIYKILNESDIKSVTEIPILGIISRVDPDRLRNGYIAISSSVRTGISEQFRMLRTNLEFMHFTNNRRVISVTSSESGEGKTFISLNLGLILALGTKRVVVVEFDLRKPRLAEFMRIKDVNGVSEYLAGKADLKDVIKPSGINSNLYIANCGQVPPNPGDLLAYPSTTRLIDELQEMFDIVIIDTPPLGIVSDALILSQLAGLNLFVVRQAVTTKKQLKEYSEICLKGKIQNPAIVFNGVGYLKQYGYYYNPNKEYEDKFAQYNPKQNKVYGTERNPRSSYRGDYSQRSSYGYSSERRTERPERKSERRPESRSESRQDSYYGKETGRPKYYGDEPRKSRDYGPNRGYGRGYRDYGPPPPPRKSFLSFFKK
jgi:capsular exopolysaccharide synthesis family protein